MNEVIPKRRAEETARLQVIDSRGNRGRASSSTAMNQHIKESIRRIVFASELDIRTLKPVARLTGVSEPQVLDTIREYVRDLEFRLTPRGRAA